MKEREKQPAGSIVAPDARRESAWGPLAQPAFRALWLAALVSNVGTLMQGVGAAWLMTSLTSAPVLVALLQTAASLPLFLVGLPAGALADVVDRRWLVIVTQVWMLGAAGLLGFLTIAHLMTPWGLLTLTFVLGLGGALSAPAWQAIIPELVPRRQLPSAVALNSAGFNLARAVGPALGGLIVAASGPGAVFLLNAASFVAVIIVMTRWKPAIIERTSPAEGVIAAVRAGIRYTRHAPALQAVLIRTAVFILPGSALWALLPIVARQNLGLEATGYGVLLGSIGFGAVGGAMLLPRLRARMSTNTLMIAFTVVYALATLALGSLHNLWAMNAAMALAGIAWISLTSNLNVSAQLTTPRWVQARALGVYLLVFQGGFAAGSAAWGALAGRVGNREALLIAAAVLVASVAAAWRWRLIQTEGLDLTPSQHWPQPELAVKPDPNAGPILITVEYHVSAEQAPEFTLAMQAVRTHRLRDGAMRWGLFQDPALPERYIETFVVTSWAEHLRQHERVTLTDKDVEDAVLKFQIAGTLPIVTHLIGVRPGVAGPTSTHAA